jgi:WD40 repeat protein
MSNKKSSIPLIAVLEEHESGVWSVAFHPFAPLMATAGGDNKIKLWDTDSHQCLATLEGHTSNVNSVAFHPTKPILVSGSDDNTMKLWDITTGECLSTTKAHPHGVSCVAFHPSEPLIASAGYIHFPKLWKLSSDNRKVTLVNDDWSKNHRHPSVNSVVFHPTDPLIATTGSDGNAMLWLLAPNNRILWLGTMVGEGTDPGRDILSVAFHPTEPFLVTGGKGEDDNLKLWQIIVSRQQVSRIDNIAVLKGHKNDVTSVAFHPSAPVIVSGSKDKTIKLWRILHDRIVCMETLPGRSRVSSVAFHPNGSLLASGSSGNTALLWDSSVLTEEGQRSMALIRGVETPLISRFFSGRMHTMPHAVQILRNKLKQRGPNFLEEIEEPARTAMERARAIASRRRPIALIEAPRLHTKPPSARSPSPKSSSARSPSPKSSSPKPSSPKSPKEDKSGGRGRTSITYRRKSHSSRKIKCHASKTQRYRRFIKM